MMPVRWSREALRDLEEAGEGANDLDPDYLLRFEMLALHAAGFLSDFPAAGEAIVGTFA